MSETKTEQLTNEEIPQPACKVASSAECHSEPVLKSDILPTFPDTPPSFDNVPCTKQIELPA